jgi:glycosyltransferase involved in cell wall biosynthesis
MKRAKVLHCITHLDVGGAQDNTLLTVERLNRGKYDVHLASGPSGRWLKRAYQYADQVYLVNHLRQGSRDIQPASDLQALFETVSLIKHQGYDIVHTHSSKAGFIGRVAAWLAHTPVILHTIHGFPFHPYMSPLRRWLYVSLEKLAAGWTDQLITVSELLKEEAIELRIAPADKVTTIYSGIDLSQFEVSVDAAKKRSELGLDLHLPVVGTVGRLSEQKAPQDFVKAAFGVLRKVPKVQFLMIGDGPLRQKIEKLVGGDSRIKILGYRQDVPQILQTFDIFVLSSWWEGLGRALTEAMIIGLPVVATNVNGVPELVIEGETGLLAPPQCPHLLAEKIVYLLQNPDTAKQFGQNAHYKVVSNFSADLMIERMSNLYQKLLEAEKVRESSITDL